MEKYQRRFPNVPHWQPAALLKHATSREGYVIDRLLATREKQIVIVRVMILISNLELHMSEQL